MLSTLMADALHAALPGAGGWLVAFAETAAPVAVAALWQGGAIALVLGVLLYLAPRVKIHMGAAQRFSLWIAAFALVVGLGFLPWFAGRAAGAIPANALSGAPTPMPASWLRIDDRWAIAIAALWLVASLVRAAALAYHSLQLRRLWKSASPIAADANLRALLTAVSPARGSHSRKVAELCTTRDLDRPSVIGFWSPRILIPEGLFARLTPGELEQVVLHEAEHLRRRDDWTNLFQKLALVLFPLNPALAWIESRLCREREMACDEGVVRRTQAPRAYAECLTSLAERRLELRLEQRRVHALSLGAFERRPELVRRVYSILARKQALHPMAARALVGVAGCSLLIASVELARCPQMVAFVPAAQSAKVQSQMAHAGSASQGGDSDRASLQPTVARADSGFRVVETSAVLPAQHGVAPPSPAAPRRAVTPSADPASVSPRELAATNAGSPHEVLLRAELPDVDAATQGQDTNASFAGKPQYVVLTTWEEVQTSPRNGAIVADYESDPPATEQSSHAADPNGGETVTRITITQLFLAVYPTGFAPHGAAPDSSGHGAKPAHAKDSGRPPAPLPVSGWLASKL